MQTKTKKLYKTRRSISAHVGRGGTIPSRRGLELIDRYTELKDSITREQWETYCDSNNLDYEHTAYDLFA